MRSRSLAILFLVAVAGGSCSSDRTQKPGTSGAQAEAGSPREDPTTIKRNVSVIVASVDSISTAEDLSYTLFVQLTSSAEEGGFANLAEAGQHVALSPDYVLGEKGEVDVSNERNSRLSALRSARPGDIVKGKITLVLNKGWLLVDVLPQ